MAYSNALKCADDIIAKVGEKIVLGTPLGIGKPNHLLNALYQRAKENPAISLKIITALTLEKPKGKSLLERNFLEPFVERVFKDYPDPEFELDRVKNTLPSNVQVIEFYFMAGKYVHNANAQRNYVSSNYTHVHREMIDHGINVLAQMVCSGKVNGREYFSLSSNPDVSLDLFDFLKSRNDKGFPTAIAAQVNQQLPFMYGDAVVEKDTFEFVFDDQSLYYKPFSTPKRGVSAADYMIGIYASTLVKDDGELQVGIGALGDALVYSLKLRQQNNQSYQKILSDLKVKEKFGDTIEKIGDTSPFSVGLLGATEMLVDGFMHLWNCGILKKKVYGDLIIQRLLNEGAMMEQVKMETIDLLLQRHAINAVLTEEDFLYLQKFGILKDRGQLRYYSGTLKLNDGKEIPARLDNEQSRKQIEQYCLGRELQNGAIIHAGFFLGPRDFYKWLRELPEEERKLIHMKSVRSINQLYGHEEIDRLHRKNARFVNTCMMMTLTGAAVSDGLENGTVISGVGGQYNFVAMAQELPDGHSILQLRSTRGEGKNLKSNIVWKYGNITIPRHLRDVVITEYGIAFIRGKTDEEVIKALLNITDSRFQKQLMLEAKKAGKLHPDYQIPEIFLNNFPERYTSLQKKLNQQGFLDPLPFGTDFTDEEILIGKALKSLKKKTENIAGLVRAVTNAIAVINIPSSMQQHLERMKLNNPKNFQEKLYRNMLVNELISLTRK